MKNVSLKNVTIEVIAIKRKVATVDVKGNYGGGLAQTERFYLKADDAISVDIKYDGNTKEK